MYNDGYTCNDCGHYHTSYNSMKFYPMPDGSDTGGLLCQLPQ